LTNYLLCGRWVVGLERYPPTERAAFGHEGAMPQIRKPRRAPAGVREFPYLPGAGPEHAETTLHMSAGGVCDFATWYSISEMIPARF
jgi:hypothetical protein